MKILLPVLSDTVTKLTNRFSTIPTERWKLLDELTTFVQKQIQERLPVNLTFICTHNSRRSHISQLWAQAAAFYYDVPNVSCYSGGTEVTAFNPRAVHAMQAGGFQIDIVKAGGNPTYEVRFSEKAKPITAFSKKYNDPFNPSKDFAAIMTCSNADEGCPMIVGAAARIPLTYNDPKAFDDTADEVDKYKQCVELIGTEMLFAFSNVRTAL